MKVKVKDYVVLTLPVGAKKVLVFWVDWHKLKGRFRFRFGHEAPRAQRPQYCGRVIDTEYTYCKE